MRWGNCSGPSARRYWFGPAATIAVGNCSTERCVNSQLPGSSRRQLVAPPGSSAKLAVAR